MLSIWVQELGRTLWESSLFATEQKHQYLGEREKPYWFLGILISARETKARPTKHRGTREKITPAKSQGVAQIERESNHNGGHTHIPQALNKPMWRNILKHKVFPQPRKPPQK